jgi:hypothetical protein
LTGESLGGFTLVILGVEALNGGITYPIHASNGGLGNALVMELGQLLP